MSTTKHNLKSAEMLEKVEALKKDKRKKAFYYIDEFSILVASIIGVVSSEIIFKAVKGVKLSSGDLNLSWISMLVSSIIAVITYGSMYTKFAYNDSRKPPYIKRLSSALLQGIAWRSMLSLTDPSAQ